MCLAAMVCEVLSFEHEEPSSGGYPLATVRRAEGKRERDKDEEKQEEGEGEEGARERS